MTRGVGEVVQLVVDILDVGDIVARPRATLPHGDGDGDAARQRLSLCGRSALNYAPISDGHTSVRPGVRRARYVLPLTGP